MTWRRSQRTQPSRQTAHGRETILPGTPAQGYTLEAYLTKTAEELATRGLDLFELVGSAAWGDLERVWRGFDQSPGAAMASARGL